MKTFFSISAFCFAATSAFVHQGPKTFQRVQSSLFSSGPVVSGFEPLTGGSSTSTSQRVERDARRTSKRVERDATSSAPRPVDNLSDKAKQMDRSSVVRIQGNSLKTWAFQHPMIDRVHVMIKTEGRPLNAEIDLWQGPDNIPQRMNVYIEDGNARPFNAVVETPGGQNTLGIRNTNTLEFPMEAVVEAEVDGKLNLGLQDTIKSLYDGGLARTVQGGAVYTKPFDSAVQSIQVLLRSESRPMYARIELLQGPNNNKQVLDIYSEDGYNRPFYIIMETPEAGNVVRIVNTATMEYPITAVVEPYVIDESFPSNGPSSFFIVD